MFKLWFGKKKNYIEFSDQFKEDQNSVIGLLYKINFWLHSSVLYCICFVFNIV